MKEKMSKEVAKVIRLTGVRELVFENQYLEMDNLSETQVSARTEYSAISPGTELGAYIGSPPLRNDVKPYPRLLGYCNVAKVIGTGAAIKNVKSGDRILTFQSHRSHFIIDEKQIIAVVPYKVPSDIASVTYLFHLGYNSLLQANAVAGTNVAVLGMGVLGLGAVAMSKISGMRVMAISDHDCQQERAISMGAKVTSNRENAIDTITSFSGESGLDLAILTTNNWDDYLLALKTVRRGGQICLIGFPGRSSGNPTFNPLAPELFYQKQLTVKAVGFSPASDVPPYEIRFTDKRNMKFLIEKISEGILPAEELISAEYPATNIESAYEDLLAHKNNPVTYVLKW
jgi:threonine dehydrogenase-like Zn-dependent dehydrogenase